MSGSKGSNKGIPITAYEQSRNEQIEINNQKLDALNLPRMNTLEQNVQPSKRTKRTQQSSDAANEVHNMRTRSQRNHAENTNEQIEDPDYQPIGDLLCDNEDLHNSHTSGSKSFPEFEARVEISKANRAKLGIHHTSGSKSFACARHEMGAELGRVPRRDEVFIKTHTRKNGVPSQQTQPIINKLKSIAQARPELIERSIQQGDVFAAACGEKEPRGRVRALGLGPTPQDVGTPGLKCYKPTRLQMEVLARKQAESDKASLERQIQELQEKLQEARRVQERNTEITSQNGSNSRNHVSPRCEGQVDEAYGEPYEDAIFADNNENSDHYDDDDYFLDPRPPAIPSVQPSTSLFAQRATVLSAQRVVALSGQHAPALSTQPTPTLSVKRAAALSTLRAAALSKQRAVAPSAQRAAAPSMSHPAAPSAVAPSVQPAPAPSAHRAPAAPSAVAPSVQPVPAPSAHRAPALSVQSVVGRSIDHQDYSATSPIKTVAPTKKKNAPHVSPADLVGKEVILLAMLRPEKVAKGVVISTNPSNALAGQPLGMLFCEVIVKTVLKRDTMLPRPYGDIQTLGDAISMPVQWPYNRLRPSNASHTSKSTTGKEMHGHKTH